MDKNKLIGLLTLIKNDCSNLLEVIDSDDLDLSYLHLVTIRFQAVAKQINEQFIKRSNA